MRTVEQSISSESLVKRGMVENFTSTLVVLALKESMMAMSVW
jgi:hypothetical protein